MLIKKCLANSRSWDFTHLRPVGSLLFVFVVGRNFFSLLKKCSHKAKLYFPQLCCFCRSSHHYLLLLFLTARLWWPTVAGDRRRRRRTIGFRCLQWNFLLWHLFLFFDHCDSNFGPVRSAVTQRRPGCHPNPRRRLCIGRLLPAVIPGLPARPEACSEKLLPSLQRLPGLISSARLRFN